MIVGKKDRQEQVRLKWENLAMRMQAALTGQDMERLLQYGALVALNSVQATPVRPVLEAAQHRLSRPAYETLERFAQPFLKDEPRHPRPR